MITNLVATIAITLVTNTTTTFPQHVVPLSENITEVNGVLMGDAVYRSRLEPDADPQRKWVRTIITRKTTATFDWRGASISVVVSEETVGDQQIEYSLVRETKAGVLTKYQWEATSTNVAGPSDIVFILDGHAMTNSQWVYTNGPVEVGRHIPWATNSTPAR